MSTVYRTRVRRHRRQHGRPPLWAIVAIVAGLFLLAGVGIASAAILLHGRGTLTAQAYKEQGLQVTAARLSRPLTPGASSDLLFSVRNSNAFAAQIDRVTLVGPLRKASPAGCTSKVTGPVTAAAGYRVPSAARVLVGAGTQRNVVVPAAFKLALSAKAGCGFTVEIDVSATQLAPASSPATTKPTTAPTSTVPVPPVEPAGPPPSSPAPATSKPITTPPGLPGEAVDEDVLDCRPAPGRVCALSAVVTPD